MPLNHRSMSVWSSKARQASPISFAMPFTGEGSIQKMFNKHSRECHRWRKGEEQSPPNIEGRHWKSDSALCKPLQSETKDALHSYLHN
jgi:hypothetical protein